MENIDNWTCRQIDPEDILRLYEMGYIQDDWEVYERLTTSCYFYLAGLRVPDFDYEEIPGVAFYDIDGRIFVEYVKIGASNTPTYMLMSKVNLR